MQPPGVTNHVSRMGRIKRDMADLDQYRRVLGSSLDMEQAIDLLTACEPDIVSTAALSIRLLWAWRTHAKCSNAWRAPLAGLRSLLHRSLCSPRFKPSAAQAGWDPHALHAARRRRLRRLLHSERVSRSRHQGAASPLSAAHRHGHIRRTGSCHRRNQRHGRGLQRQGRYRFRDCWFGAGCRTPHRKPVLAVNTVIYWAALRQLGIMDPITGYGSLVKTHLN